MSLAEDIAAAAAKTGADAQAAADRVTADLGAARGALADAQQALTDYIVAHPDDTEALTGALASVISADGIVASIDPAPAPPAPTVVSTVDNGDGTTTTTWSDGTTTTGPTPTA